MDILRLLVGSVLFLATAFVLQRRLLPKEAEAPERLALGLSLALLIPGLLLLLLNLTLGLPITVVTVYAAYLLIGLLVWKAPTHAWKGSL